MKYQLVFYYKGKETKLLFWKDPVNSLTTEDCNFVKMGFSHLLLALLTIMVELANATSPSRKCSFFSNTTLSHSSIRFSASIAANSSFTDDSPEASSNAVQTSLPASCRVACEVQTSNSSSAIFEVWLPVDGESDGKFMAVGNGEWAGGINYPDICDLSETGFVHLTSKMMERNF